LSCCDKKPPSNATTRRSDVFQNKEPDERY
jgi:hypothetical protein